MRKIIGILLCVGLFASTAQASEEINIIIKKQEIRRANRWSLQDWLDTRDRMRLMDLWLALHSPSPYEFFVGAEYRYTPTSTGVENGLGAQGAAYASIFGLGLDIEVLRPSMRVDTSFLLRLFGMQAQGTNLTIELGLRNEQDGASWVRSPFVGGLMTLYFVKFFGIDGRFRWLFNGSRGPSGQIGGFRGEASAFIDFSFLRVFGGYFFEKERAERIHGFHGGVRLFF